MLQVNDRVKQNKTKQKNSKKLQGFKTRTLRLWRGHKNKEKMGRYKALGKNISSVLGIKKLDILKSGRKER